MRNKIVLLLVFISSIVQAQLLPNWSSYYETGFVWNPALTAKWNYSEASVTHRQDWVGFDDSPQYTNISFQKPMLHGVLTKSAYGVFIERDKVGPQEKYGAAATYNYRVRPLWFGENDDVLSLGFMFNLSYYSFNLANATVFDPNNLVINQEEVSHLINPNVGLGAFYISVSDYYGFAKTHYYFGLSLNQLAPLPIAKFDGRSNDINLLKIRSKFHATLHGGYRFVPNKRKFYFYEPGLMMIYGSGYFHAMGTIKYEERRSFWLAGGLATTGEIFAQAGVILGENSFISNLVKDGELRIGLKSNFNLGSVRRLSAMGLEFYAAYTFELE